MMTGSFLRSVRLTPYRKGYGPRFTLTITDTGRTDHLGKFVLGYRLVQIGNTRTPDGRSRRVIFEGEDFACSPLHAIDSDDTIASLLGFLTLRPGDTDAEYFANYTDVQREYCDLHAETLAVEVSARFGDL